MLGLPDLGVIIKGTSVPSSLVDKQAVIVAGMGSSASPGTAGTGTGCSAPTGTAGIGTGCSAPTEAWTWILGRGMFAVIFGTAPRVRVGRSLLAEAMGVSTLLFIVLLNHIGIMVLSLFTVYFVIVIFGRWLCHS